MAAAQGGTRQRRSQKDKESAAMMKRLGIERTSGICALCYSHIGIQSSQSRYRHICPGGKLRR